MPSVFSPSAISWGALIRLSAPPVNGPGMFMWIEL